MNRPQPHDSISVSGDGQTTVTVTYISWLFDSRAAGRRAVRRHRDALRKLADR